MKFEDLRVGIQRVRQKLRNLKKHERKGLFIIFIAVFLVIASFFLVPFINSERIWKSGDEDYFTIHQNSHLGNQYEVIVSYSGSLLLKPSTGSIKFRNLKTSITYTFNYDFTDYTPDYSNYEKEFRGICYARKTFEMPSGKYSVDITSGSGCFYQLFEKGIIPKYSDWIAYLLIIGNSIIIVLLGCKKYKGWLPRKFSCQNCGEPVLLKNQVCQKCWEESFEKNFEGVTEYWQPHPIVK